MKRFRGDAAAVAVLFAATTAGLAAIYWPMLRDPNDLRFFGFGDSWTYYGPTSYFVDRSLHAGEFPLWNPLIFEGQPIAGNPQYLLFYPPNLIRSLLTLDPTPWKTHVGLAIVQWLHIIIAGLGCYALTRHLSLSRTAGVAAAIAFTFSSAFLNRVYGHLYIVQVATWLPWSLLFLRLQLESDTALRRSYWTVALGIGFALAILAGTPQLSYLVGISLAVYWFLLRAQQAWELWRSGGRIFGLFRQIGRDLVYGLASVLIAVALSAALLGPALEFNRYTPRGAAQGVAYETLSGDPGWSLVERLLIYAVGENYEGIKTLSASGLVLVVAASLSSRRRALVPFAGLAALLFAGSVEESPVHALLVRLAPFPYGASARAAIAGVLPLAILAGAGVDALRAGVAAGRARVAFAVGTTAFAAVICGLTLRRLDDVRVPVSYEVLLFPILVAAAAVASQWSRHARRCCVALPVLVLAEAVTWQGAAIREMCANGKKLFASVPLATATGHPRFWAGNSRGTSVQPNTPFYRLEPEINGYDPLFHDGVLDLLYPGRDIDTFFRGASAFSVSWTTKLPYLLLKRSFWLHDRYVAGELPPATKNFPPSTTVYVANTDSLSVPRIAPDEVVNTVYSGDVGRVVVAAQPKTFTPQSHPTFDDPLVWASKVAVPPQHKSLALYVTSDCAAVFTIITREDSAYAEDRIVASFDVSAVPGLVQRIDVPMPDLESMILGLVVIFPESSGTLTLERVELVVDRSDESQRLANLRRTANGVEIEVRDLPGPRILSHIDFAYPGWRAYLDGAEVPILRAFSFFKAVEVPAGTHRVRFEFRPISTYVAMAISAVAWIICLALLGGLSWPSRRSLPAVRAREAPLKRRGRRGSG